MRWAYRLCLLVIGFSTLLGCWPEPRNAVATKRGEEWAHASGSGTLEIVEFRSRSDGVRGVSQPSGQSRRR
jgi:hypothetical protein